MKFKINIKSIIFMTIIALASLLFINISFAGNTGKITVETAKLREKPNTDSKVLELASEGEEVEILEKIDGWYKVKYKRITGYIRNDLIKVEDKKENITNTETNNVIDDEKETNKIDTTNNTTKENEIIETTTTPVKQEKDIEKAKYKLSETIKLKIIPLISAIEIDEIGKDTEVEAIENLNNWVKIKTSDGKEGWTIKDKLSEIQENIEENKTEQKSEKQPTEQRKNDTQVTNTTKTMYVNSQSINVREKASKTSQVIKQLTINNKVTVLSSENGWAYVDINGTKGYIAENLLSSTKQETSRSSTTRNTTTQNKTNTQSNQNTTAKNNITTPEAPSSGNGSTVVSYAKQFLGCKYVYGGTTTNGFDCSGFTQYVYRHFGVNLNRTAAAQYSNGTSTTTLQAGDLVMFGRSGINHVGIYIGGNTFIHAANPSRGVTIDTLSSGYYKTNYVGARRIL